MEKFHLGEKVFAQWEPEVYFYPGTIVEINGDNYTINFDDSDQAIVTYDQLSQMNIDVGSRVFCRFKSEKVYYPGVVDQKTQEEIHVKYDDGDEEWTTISMIRMER